MADFITVVKDAELAPQLVGWQPDPAGFFVELLSPAALFAQVGPADEALEPPAVTAACAVFDGDTGLLEVRIQSGLRLAPAERHVARAVLAGVWAPARVRLAYEAWEEGAQILVYRGQDMFARVTQVRVTDLAKELSVGPSRVASWEASPEEPAWVDTRAGALLDETRGELVVWPKDALGDRAGEIEAAWACHAVRFAADIEEHVAEHIRGGSPIDGRMVKALLDAFAPADEAELHRNVAFALHARGFGELPPGRAWTPPEDETELMICTLAFALRAARAGEGL